MLTVETITAARAALNRAIAAKDANAIAAVLAEEYHIVTALNSHSCGAFCHLAFSAARPAIRRYERAKVSAGTLGAAFRERRWSRGLEQWEAAQEIGVSVATIAIGK